MCGITGFFSPTNEVNTSDYYRAHSLIKHRGPDDEGFVVSVKGEIKAFKGDDTIAHFGALENIRSVQGSKLALGHRRLSIIDLTHKGHQPFSDKKGEYWLVFNGEIFNYLELRQELKGLGHHFRTDSDTEVLLNSYIQWGTAAFNKFNGMWAIAIYDSKEHSLILSRDRFGIKPLYYSLHNGVIYFASEIKFLRAFIDSQFFINAESVQVYLDKSYVNFSGETFWKEINELEPAHFLLFNRDSDISLKKYWTFQPSTKPTSDQDALEQFAAIFEDSLRLRMRSDVEVGTLLSGGLDSTLIVCTLFKLGFISQDTFKSFSAVFEDERFSEKAYIDKTIEKTGLEPYFVYPKAEELTDYIDKIIYHIEEPFRSLSVFSQFLIYEKINKDTKVKVVLNGQGGDELFGGYSYDYFYLFGSLLKKFRIKKLLREIKLFKENRGSNTREVAIHTLRNFVKALGCSNYFNDVTFRQLKETALREYLKYDDRTSMAFAVEARVPFLDYRLVEFAFSLEEKYKIDNYENKKIERKYSKGIIPEEVRQRKDKMGFVSPQEIWQKNELRREFERVFLENSASPFVNDQQLIKQYQDYMKGKNNNWEYIWRIYCLHRWMKIYQVT